MNDRTKKFALSAVIAAVTGYLAGILTAPKSGRETRQDIKNTAKKGVAEAEKQLTQAHAELDKLLGEAKAKGAKLSGKAKPQLDNVLSAATSSRDKAAEVLSAVRGKGTNDKDLKKAMGEATKAIAHLRKYLAK
jgi:gas vesicle protein